MNQVIKAQGADDLETAFKDMMKEKVLVQTNGHDTVGAVAIDENGDLASATSTGQTKEMNKKLEISFYYHLLNPCRFHIFPQRFRP